MIHDNQITGRRCPFLSLPCITNITLSVTALVFCCPPSYHFIYPLIFKETVYSHKDRKGYKGYNNEKQLLIFDTSLS